VKGIKTRLTGYLESLRFPWLLLVTAVLLLVDLFLPDVIPFVDEIVLALVAVVLSRLKRKAPPSGGPEKPREV
jgi:hypothetical protein